MKVDRRSPTNSTLLSNDKVDVLDQSPRRINDVLQLFVHKTLPHVHSEVDLIFQIAVDAIDRLVVSIGTSYEDISVEKEQEDGVLIQQILVVVEDAVWFHTHAKLGVLIRMVKIVPKILDRL